MKSKKVFSVFVLVSALFFFGCVSKPVRYTMEEIQSYPADVQQRIVKGEVSTGMTYQQVRYAWEAPNSVKKIQTKDSSVQEEWLYSSSMGICKINLLFAEGKLTGSVVSSGQTPDNASSPIRYTKDEIKVFPADIQSRIIKGEVATGMTQLQVRYAWGGPDSAVVVKTKDNSLTEDWIYSSSGLCRTRLIFINGKLAATSLDDRK